MAAGTAWLLVRLLTDMSCCTDFGGAHRLTKGTAFALERVKQATDLTPEMLASGEWKDKTFKAYNFQVSSSPGK